MATSKKPAAKKAATPKLTAKDKTALKAWFESTYSKDDSLKRVLAHFDKLSNTSLENLAKIRKYTELDEQGLLTAVQGRYLANAWEKVECKGAMRLYKDLKAASTNAKSKRAISAALGGKPFPALAAFLKKLPEKPLYSYWDGTGVLSKFNVKGIVRQRVQTQQKRSNKKAELAAAA